MVSKGSDSSKNINFKINSKNIEIVKYLGITVRSKNCSFTPTLPDQSR